MPDLNGRQITIICIALAYMAANIDDVNDAFYDDEEDLLKINGQFVPEVNEVELTALRKEFE